MDKKIRSPNDIAHELTQYLAKSRDSLTATEVDLINETIDLLLDLNDLTATGKNKFIIQTILQVTFNLIRFFSNEEVIKFLKDLL